KTIFAHGWWMLGEGKMSKSKGNVVSPLLMADKYGVDVYRYFLLRDVPFGLDGNFSEEAIVKRFNADLANDLGNLVFRTLTMIEKYFSGSIPKADTAGDTTAKAIVDKVFHLEQELSKSLCSQGNYNFSSALEAAWVLIGMANKYIEDTKPWNLAKENKTEELKGFIRLLAEVIRKVAEGMAPFMPETAASIQEQIGLDKIKKGNPLFPRIQ
ncbi:MAG: class I tRNA ligase family protein, partial [Candidatus Omnitrophota bacterium]